MVIHGSISFPFAKSMPHPTCNVSSQFSPLIPWSSINLGRPWWWARPWSCQNVSSQTFLPLSLARWWSSLCLPKLRNRCQSGLSLALLCMGTKRQELDPHSHKWNYPGSAHIKEATLSLYLVTISGSQMELFAVNQGGISMTLWLWMLFCVCLIQLRGVSILWTILFYLDLI